jgi:signal transduction histidine kinase
LQEEDNDVVLQVIDSGHGIPPACLAKLFDPFYTTKAVGEGTGLGLSTAKGILDEHKATITVITKCPNTCFEIRFKKAQVMSRVA